MRPTPEQAVPEAVFLSTGDGVMAFQLPVFGEAGPLIEKSEIQYNIPNLKFQKIVEKAFKDHVAGAVEGG